MVIDGTIKFNHISMVGLLVYSEIIPNSSIWTYLYLDLISHFLFPCGTLIRLLAIFYVSATTYMQIADSLERIFYSIGFIYCLLGFFTSGEAKRRSYAVAAHCVTPMY